MHINMHIHIYTYYIASIVYVLDVVHTYIMYICISYTHMYIQSVVYIVYVHIYPYICVTPERSFWGFWGFWSFGSFGSLSAPPLVLTGARGQHEKSQP